ncbi:tRNA (adenosine(37)-N6)-threonylcarbamoyltransferase complex ATPase subunit type 1 TsaE [Mycoplasma marinum]|uniref:tRNA threonylcarbamoyladenosine biosynthesis protein TsaE n=1 Tax=Mycoplasma marinum TaxID=1937190 RepID=A0A4R0XJM0_9MOLU|nr:tRNA (adenosine(37)-N6)-threonylcarbamoyltransferase complex ATPase subunit type 1 TsaE [Mycoplasma marinum]TCG10823.1 tRNA (adenosine(37)-N6)-threonylcarbamoyltransferase complex ATPase subunit type 1 TsaE [Mycoplasma marinum]
MKHISRTLKDTEIFAKEFIGNLKTRFVLLNGQMGAGKTTLIKFIAKELGETDVVTSPTFNIMKVYEKFVHIDAYKITGSLEEYEDYFEDKIVFIEWSNNLDEIFDDATYINVSMGDNNEHIYEVI